MQRLKKEDSFKISLPKWPECRVDGVSVTQEQAQEILIRTQGFHLSTNDHKFETDCLRELGVKVKDQYPYFDWDEINQKREEYKCLNIDFLQNDRIASCYIGGPNGWLDWDGTIYQTDKNIGKWPSVSSVYDEWKLIAKAFPYLDLRCQLFNGENCEEGVSAVVEFVVKNGNVRMKKPTDELLPQHPKVREQNFKQLIKSRFLNDNLGEHGITVEGFKQALEQTKKSLTQG